MTRFVNPPHGPAPRRSRRSSPARSPSGLRNYFTGVTIVAAFNAVVVGLGALVLGVPLPGTIAVVTFITAYVPYIGAWTAAESSRSRSRSGPRGPQDALILAVIIFLANGAAPEPAPALRLRRHPQPQPARGTDRDRRRRRPVRHGGDSTLAAPLTSAARAHQRCAEGALADERRRRPAFGPRDRPLDAGSADDGSLERAAPLGRQVVADPGARRGPRRPPPSRRRARGPASRRTADDFSGTSARRSSMRASWRCGSVPGLPRHRRRWRRRPNTI